MNITDLTQEQRAGLLSKIDQVIDSIRQIYYPDYIPESSPPTPTIIDHDRTYTLNVGENFIGSLKITRNTYSGSEVLLKLKFETMPVHDNNTKGITIISKSLAIYEFYFDDENGITYKYRQPTILDE